jgi:uncharacterized cupin superfamily protein
MVQGAGKAAARQMRDSGPNARRMANSALDKPPAAAAGVAGLSQNRPQDPKPTGATMSTKAEELRAKLIRNFNDVPLTRETREPLYDSMGARLARGTAALKMGASIDVLEPGKRGCPYHLHHAQEEMFIVLEGHGTMRVAGEMLAVKAGDIVFMPPGPDYPHQMINTSDAPLKYLSLSTRDVPEVVEYPDSNKVLTNARVGGNDFGLARMNRLDTDLDYWDGEP